MIRGIGVDIEEIKRFEDSLSKKEFLRLVFTDKEIDYCKNKKEPQRSLAGKFCAKEAVIKASGKKMQMNEIEIHNDPGGAPQVYINGKPNNKIKCSISHAGEYAIAFVVMDGE